MKSVLLEDDLEYPAENVPLIIDKYKSEFDLNTVDFKFSGNISEYGAFIYIVKGKKADAEKEHQFEVVCGDGLVALRDDWIPR